jgi:hypothetical protein
MTWRHRPTRILVWPALFHTYGGAATGWELDDVPAVAWPGATRLAKARTDCCRIGTSKPLHTPVCWLAQKGTQKLMSDGALHALATSRLPVEGPGKAERL